MTARATVTMTRDVDALADEYFEVASRVDQLTNELAAATKERNAVLAALSETDMTQVEIANLTGLTVARLRTAVWNAHRDWRR